MSSVERIYCQDKENSCSLNGHQPILNGPAKFMADFSGLDHISVKLMSCVMENEESLEEKDKKIEANKFYEKDQRIDVNKFFDDLKRSDSWESTEESNEVEDEDSCITLVEIPTLSDAQRCLLITSWDLIQDKISIVGVSAYNELFRLSPQAIQFFPQLFNYREGDEERFQEVVKDHSIRILGIIGLIVRNLTKIQTNDPKAYYSFYKFSFQLGEKHFRYGANPRLMGLLGLAFATSMKETLIEYEDPEKLEEAWKSFFCVVTSWMRRGFLYIQNKGREVDVYKLPLEEVLGS